jgi:hypothetical protein
LKAPELVRPSKMNIRDNRTASVAVRLSPAECLAITEALQMTGLSRGEWLRAAIAHHLRSSAPRVNPSLDIVLLEEIRELRSLVINLVPSLVPGYPSEILDKILSNAREIKRSEAQNILINWAL